MPITTKVVRMPGLMQEVMVMDGATVADVLAAANIELATGESLAQNGAPASTTDAVVANGAVVISKAAKGA